MNKKKILVYLSEEEHKRLKIAALRQNVSMSSILRRSLDTLPKLEKERSYARVQPPEY